VEYLRQSASARLKDLLRNDPTVLRLAGTVSGAHTSDQVVALTFDDGPLPANTLPILSVLAERGAHATFFVLAEQAEAWPAIVAEILSGGHEVGLHGHEHRDLTRCSARQVMRVVGDGRRRLEQVAERRIGLFRPPYGTQSLVSYLAARMEGMEVVGWTSSPRDFLALDCDWQARLALDELAPGGIALFHDGPPSAPVHRTALLGRFLEGVAERGWRGVSVEELLEGRDARRRLWFRRREAALVDEMRPLRLTAEA
jgi:peptidoglycan/xylan/chitin deacetylase (PgdA/CDA1 family)